MATPLILSDSIILALNRRPELTAVFPEFKLAETVGTGKGCKCRGGQQRIVRAGEYDRVRKALLQLPQDRLTQFKQLAKTNQLVIYLRTPKGVQKHLL